LKVATDKAALHPNDIGWQLHLIACHANIGNTLGRQGDLDGALKAFQDAMEIRQKLVSHNPANGEWQSSLARGHSQIGGTLALRGDRAGANNHYLAAKDIRQKLAASGDALR
jgi:tetratricopeptide (TPR) repeat protein